MNDPITLITFDLDDTLWPCAPTIERAEAAHHHWLCEHAPDLAATHDVESLRAHRRALMHARPDLGHDLTALRRISLEHLLSAHGYPAELAGHATRVFLEARNLVEPYADVRRALHVLGKRFRLVSVTNGNADVERTPLSGHFEFSFSAGDVGVAKPDPALFQRALDAVGASPEQALHVGDDPFLDVEAARRAGMHTAWANRRCASWPSELAPPAHTVSDLRQLTYVLGLR